MSLRNELRGPRQSEADWYRYVTLGATAIHEANPDLLVVVSGLSYDTDLSFLSSRPLPSRLDGKLVFETHWYSFPRRREWEALSPTRVCSDAAGWFDARARAAGKLMRGRRSCFAVSLFQFLGHSVHVEMGSRVESSVRRRHQVLAWPVR